MADASVLEVVRRYLRNLAGQGIRARVGIIFGSYASGHPDPWSDIDLLVVSAVFDGAFSREAVNCLWRVAARTAAGSSLFPAASANGRRTPYATP